MFDPTIFDNLKVVMEGAVYDQDFEGNLQVIGRSDNIDLAIMSREFSINFQLCNHIQTSCRWVLSSSVRQLSSEILGGVQSTEQGCSTTVEFIINTQYDESKIHNIKSIIDNVWLDRECEYSIISTYPIKDNIQLKARIDFLRVLLEEDIDDLMIMLNYIEKTLKLLQKNGY